VRPEVVAFRELDTLVRNLTEQLAGYRRRAMAAEARARELEQDLALVKAALDEATVSASAASESREHALAAAREATASARLAREALAEVEQRSSAHAASAHAATAAAEPVTASNGAADAENERLRGRLNEARERTVQLAERVRFLRQQLVQGAER
jgi:hypothetical protein